MAVLTQEQRQELSNIRRAITNIFNTASSQMNIQELDGLAERHMEIQVEYAYACIDENIEPNNIFLSAFKEYNERLARIRESIPKQDSPQYQEEEDQED